MEALPLTINGVTYYPEGKKKRKQNLFQKVWKSFEWAVWGVLWSLALIAILFLLGALAAAYWEVLKGWGLSVKEKCREIYLAWIWDVCVWCAQFIAQWLSWLPLVVQLWGMSQLSPYIARGTDYFTWFNLCKRPFLQEKAMPGSVPTQNKTPNFQFEIRTLSDVKIGQGFRTSLDGLDVLVTAYHNVVDEVVLVTAMGRVLVKQGDFMTIPTLDIAYLPYMSNLYSVLGLSKAKPSGKGPNCVAAVVDGGFGTFGGLSDNAFFGYLTYSGSTWGGCSGAPYFLGNTVFGMHLGNGGVNMGLDITFMDAILANPPDHGADVLCEGTADYIYDSMEKGTKVEYDYSGNPDVVTVRMRGKYYSVDTDSVAGGKLMKRLSQQDRVRFGKVEMPEGAIPAAAMMSGNIHYEDQVAGSFLGQRPILLRKEETTPSTPATTTVTPVIQNSASAGPIQQKERSKAPIASTKTSQKQSAKVQQRKNLIEVLWQQWKTLNPGDSRETFDSTIAPVSMNGLISLSSGLSNILIGRQA